MPTTAPHPLRSIAAAMTSCEDGSLAVEPYFAAVCAVNLAMVISDPREPNCPVVFANDAFCRLTGYFYEEIVGQNALALLAKGSDPTMVGRLHAATEAARPIEIDLRIFGKDGTAFWARASVASTHDTTGNLAYLIASFTDITAIRDQMDRLEADNAALRATLEEGRRANEIQLSRTGFAAEAAHLGLWELDLLTQSLVTSPLCKRVFGRDPAAPFGYAQFCATVHPDDRPRLRSFLEATSQAVAANTIECRINLPDHSMRWIMLDVRIERSDNQTPIGISGICRDITTRKRAESWASGLTDLDMRMQDHQDPSSLAFLASEFLALTLGVSRAGYGTVDLARETITIERDWNAQGITTLAGVLNFRDYGSYIEDLKRGETVLVTNAELDPRTSQTADALKAISATSFINMPVTEDRGLVALLYLNHNMPRDWLPDEIAFVREVAHRTRMAVERRRAETDLRALAVSLEAQVTARTTELMQVEAALRQAQKMEAVGQLTGGLAHDFNNLLTGISGSLQLLQARIAQGRVGDIDRYVHAAQGAARRAASLTHRLLAFSRQQTLDPKVVDVNRLIIGMQELIQRTVGPSVSIEVVASGGLWNVLADPGQIENTLLNLCINARDAMPNGGKVTIETANRWLDERAAQERQLPRGQYVSMCVSDTGTGMSPDVIARAFDPFFTTKPIGMGTGLGLSMIYGFARQSGGQVRIYSEVNQGTMVCIYLPRSLGKEEVPPETSELVTSAQNGRGETVLVVDDDHTVRMLVIEVLEEIGYAAIEASDAQAGLRILQSDVRIDLLVSDVGLPGGMNGRQMADMGRQRRPGLKVMFITGYAENAVLNHGHLDHGMHVLTKPFTLEDLASRIRELIGTPPAAN